MSKRFFRNQHKITVSFSGMGINKFVLRESYFHHFYIYFLRLFLFNLTDFHRYFALPQEYVFWGFCIVNFGEREREKKRIKGDMMMSLIIDICDWRYFDYVRLIFIVFFLLFFMHFRIYRPFSSCICYLILYYNVRCICLTLIFYSIWFRSLFDDLRCLKSLAFAFVKLYGGRSQTK